MNHDETYMARCLELARLGAKTAAPNPMVGSVIVHEQEVIGEGFHQKPGGPHAEVNAIRAVTDASKLQNATLYVNLEPCSHFGRTPPCADLLIESEIPRVVIGCLDVNPKVSGRGIEKLRSQGIAVKTGVLEQECAFLNRRFETFHQKKRPYIILKWAKTQDGFMARADGSSQWISSESSRKLVHQWRAEEAAIMVGTETALRDDPELTVRHVEGPNPLRIVLDRTGRLPPTLRLFNSSAPSLYVTERGSAPKNTELLRLTFGTEFFEKLLAYLYDLEIQSLFVEGGATLLTSLIEARLFDEARVFTSLTQFGEGLAAPVVPLTLRGEVKALEAGDRLEVFFANQGSSFQKD